MLIPVTVTDPANRIVTGLEKENFRIFEDKTEQEISQFSNEDAAAFRWGWSSIAAAAWAPSWRSRAWPWRSSSRHANPDGRVLPGAVQRRRQVVQPFTTNLAEIQNRLTFTQSKGRTALLDAVYLGLQEMKKAGNPRKALLIISDGGDNNSRYTEGEIKNLVKEADVQIYAIGIYESARSAGAHAGGNGRARRLLTDIAEQTGGRQYAGG